MGFDEGQPLEETFWGRTGCDPDWDAYYASGRKGNPPLGNPRWGSGGGYVGILVFIVACWTLLQTFRKGHTVFNPIERRLIWFWGAIGVVGLLLSFGRYAPFYKLLYSLPYASTVRIPSKYLHVLNWSLLVLFTYGIYGLSRRGMDSSATVTRDLFSQWHAWWTKASIFDKRWVKGSWLVLAASVVGWMVYSSKRAALVGYLQDVQFSAEHANRIADFSFNQVGIFTLFFAVGLGLFTLTLSGYFSGRRALVGVCLISVFLVVDLARVGSRWLAPIYNFKERYVRAADNDVIKLLKQKPYEGRVASLPAPTSESNWVLRKEWLENIFQYYNIQSLDVIQMSRVPEQVAAFEGALAYNGKPDNYYKLIRRWQLTNTKYLIGPLAAYSELNTKIDPQQRFQPRIIFEFEHLSQRGPALVHTVTPDRNRYQSQFALFEFTGALPRVKLYSHWQVITNDQATLTQLASKDFNPEQTVLVAEAISQSQGSATNASPGTVEHTGYGPRRIELRAKVESPCVLLLNDKHDPTWKVFVDGKPAPMLRCNYIMRGVQLDKGEHIVEFRFEPVMRGLGISVAMDALGVVLIAFVVLRWRRGDVVGVKELEA
jgi:hypothetical protein